MGRMNAFLAWSIAIIIALFSGWLIKSGDLAVLFAGFVLFCFSASLAGYQIIKTRAEKRTSSHSYSSSMPKGAMGIGAILMGIPALIGYLIP